MKLHLTNNKCYAIILFIIDIFNINNLKVNSE